MGAKSLGAWFCLRSCAEDSGICRISEMSRRPSARMMIAFPCLSSSLSFISSLRLSHSPISSSSRPRGAPGSLGFESHFHTVQREFTHRLEARSPGSDDPQLWEEECHPSSSVSSGCCEQPSSTRTRGVVLSPVESLPWKQGVEELGPSTNHPLEVTLQAGSLQHDVGVTFLVLLGGYVWVKLFNSLTKRQVLGQVGYILLQKSSSGFRIPDYPSLAKNFSFSDDFHKKDLFHEMLIIRWKLTTSWFEDSRQILVV